MSMDACPPRFSCSSASRQASISRSGRERACPIETRIFERPQDVRIGARHAARCVEVFDADQPPSTPFLRFRITASAATSEPKCSGPVGDGANRPTHPVSYEPLTANLADQLDTAGISWSGYMENIPSSGYSGGDTGCQDGFADVLYVQHHNPFAYFPDLAGDLPTHVKPVSSMVSDLNSADPPVFVWVTPNMLDDMHDGPLSNGDTWLSQEIPAIQQTQWYQQGGQIILTFDEGAASDTTGLGSGAGGHIPGFLISQPLLGEPNDTTPVDQAGILRSIEQLYGLPLLNDATSSVHGNLGRS